MIRADLIHDLMEESLIIWGLLQYSKNIQRTNDCLHHMKSPCWLTGKPHTIGESLILPAAKKIIEIMLGEGSSNKVSQALHLSNTVSRRIDEMAADVEDKLINMLRWKKFSLQIDESTVSDSRAILLSYVRFINEEKEMNEEMLFSKTLNTDTQDLRFLKWWKNILRRKIYLWQKNDTFEWLKIDYSHETSKIWIRNGNNNGYGK